MPGYNLIGQKFNRLTVMGTAGTDRHGNKQWKCLCDCGNYTTVISSHLIKGRVKSCGCWAKDHAALLNYKDMTNQTFNRLTARYKAYKSEANGQYYWYCDCTCGGHKIVRGDSLRNGSIKSCGCLRTERNFNDLSGQTFGSLQIIEPTEQRHFDYIVWHCICLKCNKDYYVSTKEIALGKESCGCD